MSGGLLDDDAMVIWQDVLDVVVAGRPGEASCPLCSHRPLQVEDVLGQTKISCAKCGAFIQGKLA